MAKRVRGLRYKAKPKAKLSPSLIRKIEGQRLLVKELGSRDTGTAKVSVKLVKSLIGCKDNQIRTAKALGLGKISSVVVKDVNPAILGMVKTISHLVEVEEIS